MIEVSAGNFAGLYLNNEPPAEKDMMGGLHDMVFADVSALRNGKLLYWLAF